MYILHRHLLTNSGIWKGAKSWIPTGKWRISQDPNVENVAPEWWRYNLKHISTLIIASWSSWPQQQETNPRKTQNKHKYSSSIKAIVLPIIQYPLIVVSVAQ